MHCKQRIDSQRATLFLALSLSLSLSLCAGVSLSVQASPSLFQGAAMCRAVAACRMLFSVACLCCTGTLDKKDFHDLFLYEPLSLAELCRLIILYNARITTFGFMEWFSSNPTVLALSSLCKKKIHKIDITTKYCFNEFTSVNVLITNQYWCYKRQRLKGTGVD